MNPIDQLADDRDKLKSKLNQAKAKLKQANARIARLEEAGDSLKEEARPTMFDTDETRKRIMDTIDAWDAAREAKP